MAQDAYVKDAEMLTGFACDLRTANSSITGQLSQLSSVTYMKESDLRVYVNRIEDALSKAHDQLDDAQYEYDYYMHHTDEEDFSPSHALSLQADVEAAENLCNQIEEDLQYAQQILDESLFLLCSLRASADGFAVRVDKLAECAAANVDAAAFEISQYKSIR